MDGVECSRLVISWRSLWSVAVALDRVATSLNIAALQEMRCELTIELEIRKELLVLQRPKVCELLG